MTIRVAIPADLDLLVETITSAFIADPLWAPVLSSRAQAAALWRMFLASTLRYPNTFVTAGIESVTAWVPPGGELLTPTEVSEFDGFLEHLGGPDFARGVLKISDILASAVPAEPHFYLSLFGTHSDHRGGGLGMDLLRANLADIDAVSGPAYLESSNPANDERYRSVGFIAQETLEFASGARVTTMWRPAR